MVDPVKERTTNCNCTLVGGLCLPPNYRNDGGIGYAPTAQSNFVRFADSDKNVDSAFFKEHFEAAAYMCTVSTGWTKSTLVL